MDLEKVKEIIRRKPPFFLFVSLAYLLAAIGMKWNIHIRWDALWFLVGGVVGVYFLDVSEVFFELTPSPFRSIVFSAAFVLVSFFVVTSSGSPLASGLVLSLYLTLVLWQVGQWQIQRSLDDWYRMVNGTVAVRTQRWILIGFVCMFLLETFLFVR